MQRVEDKTFVERNHIYENGMTFENSIGVQVILLRLQIRERCHQLQAIYILSGSDCTHRDSPACAHQL